MNGAEFQKAIERLGLTQVGAAKFLGVNETTSRRWIANRHPVPPPVAMLLNTMIKQGLVPEEVWDFTRKQ